MKYTRGQSFEYENGFMLMSDVYRLGNILAHYELYKKIIDLPGDIIELGVFKGNSLIQFATFRELLENERSRKIVGFDSFGAFPKAHTVQSDKKFVDDWNETFCDELLSKEYIEKCLNDKGIGNFELVQGDILSTVDAYIEKNRFLRIALLHIDTDVYEPTQVALEKLFDRVVRGGVIIFDDYGTVEGETLAIEEFFSKYPEYRLKKFSFSHAKPSWIIK